jgi:hypothetical protein
MEEDVPHSLATTPNVPLRSRVLFGCAEKSLITNNFFQNGLIRPTLFLKGWKNIFTSNFLLQAIKASYKLILIWA